MNYRALFRVAFALAVLAATCMQGCSSDSNKSAGDEEINENNQAESASETADGDEETQLETYAEAPEESVAETTEETSVGDESASEETAETEQPIEEELAQEEAPQAVLNKISCADLEIALAGKDFLFINVHVPYEGEIPGTDKHISYLKTDDIVSYIGSELGKKVVVYCMSNYMSLIAGNALVGKGYYNVFYLDGGMSKWKSEGRAFTNP